jgi:hypothetical protein
MFLDITRCSSLSKGSRSRAAMPGADMLEREDVELVWTRLVFRFNQTRMERCMLQSEVTPTELKVWRA